MTSVVIKTRKGKFISGRQYLALKSMRDARGSDHACRHGHYGCAAWEGGPCSDEIAASLLGRNDTGGRTLASPPNKSWAPEVIADSSGKWCGNVLRFATREEAEENVRELSWRWMLVRDTRVVESADPVNYAWDVERGLVDLRKGE